MSTFDGVIREIPGIQVDYFRTPPDRERPLACFLSHAHTDHLSGLDTLRAPFVYCSAATRALVLQLQTRSTRTTRTTRTDDEGEGRRTYRHLASLLKALPLQAPTVLELAPGRRLQVTLLDANHCPGSAMFLIESASRAVLYTGDTRLEPWFVDALVRSPCLTPYTAGLRVLDCMYLDTSCLDPARVVPSKAAGLAELARAVAGCAPDAVFHVHAWTLGYEDVWVALSQVLGSRVHVGPYKMQLYRALEADGVHLDPAAAALVGHARANTRQPGCLTSDPGGVRLHSCDKDDGYCEAMQDAIRGKRVVWLRPVAGRLKGEGAQLKGEGAASGAEGGVDVLDVDVDLEDDHSEPITFPFARHSSYAEQCDLLDRLRPRDVWPCTVRGDAWTGPEPTTMSELFGRFCRGSVFRHDAEAALRPACKDAARVESQTTDGRSWTPEAHEPPLKKIKSEAIETEKSKQKHTTAPSELPYFYRTPRDDDEDDVDDVDDSQASALSACARETRAGARAAVEANAAGGAWRPVSLASTADNHAAPECDLGVG